MAATPSYSPPSDRNVVQEACVLGVTVLLSAALIGWIYHLVARYFDLMILAPILVGMLAALPVGGVMARIGWRHAKSAIVLGALAGACALAFRHHFDAQELFGTELPTVLSQQTGITFAEAQKRIAAVNAREGIWKTYRTYFELSAASGVEIKDSHSSGSSHSSPLSGTSYYVLIVASMALAGFVGARVCMTNVAKARNAPPPGGVRLTPKGERPIDQEQSG